MAVVLRRMLPFVVKIRKIVVLRCSGGRKLFVIKFTTVPLMGFND